MRELGPAPAGGDAGAARSDTARNRVPGEAGVWLLIFGEMSVFAALFASYLAHRAADAAVFAASQAELSKATGLANTLLLLTSSLLVAMAVRAAGQARTDAAPRLFAAGLVCGLTFIGLKGVEYHALFARGVSVASNAFFGFYFGLTALHLGHVVIGCVILGALARATRQPLTRPSTGALIESAGCFWHMVDVLWIIIFALLYLVE